MPPIRQRGAELTPTLRARICELRDAGWSYGKIAAQVSRLGDIISRSTVQTICRREIKRVNNQSRPRPGTPRVITEVERDMMMDIILYQDPYIKWRDLARECETAHERSIRRLFADLYMRKWRSMKRPFLTQEHADKRLA